MFTNIKLLYCCFIYFFVLCVIVRIKPRVCHVLGQCSSTK